MQTENRKKKLSCNTKSLFISRNSGLFPILVACAKYPGRLPRVGRRPGVRNGAGKGVKNRWRPGAKFRYFSLFSYSEHNVLSLQCLFVKTWIKILWRLTLA